MIEEMVGGQHHKDESDTEPSVRVNTDDATVRSAMLFSEQTPECAPNRPTHKKKNSCNDRPR